jgi:hypothetical protein
MGVKEMQLEVVEATVNIATKVSNRDELSVSFVKVIGARDNPLSVL